MLCLIAVPENNEPFALSLSALILKKPLKSDGSNIQLL